ncbi:ATP-binding cassette domain-containing protein [Aliidiomarina sanyensis]|uniref:Peptide ABC transporter ATP-binding protein n=1 Tax=Aliidiomarina sanyensis TaxID=1249555 RepID=A0A432WRP8_9GAMM|nr:ATP-binding cassette domain-containing protein [Aliidiomarina sanyensis]RUO36399.1 peptide ABC transporter ATP-binding protein [Aliidiomarina sanyensis]
MKPLLEVRELGKVYPLRQSFFRRTVFTALQPTSFQLMAGKTLAIMGANGSGKSTLAGLIAGAIQPSQGEILLNGQRLQPDNYRQRAQHIRMVFQDAEASLNPHLTIGSQLEEPLLFNTGLNQSQRRERVVHTLQQVGLLAEHMVFYPHMLSTGQKQRVSIARAIILNPQLLVADEALATLDSSVRAQIINLLLDLQQDLKMSYIFISQSPEIVRHLADDVLIMKDGRIIEQGAVDTVFDDPQERYTQSLLLSELT